MHSADPIAEGTSRIADLNPSRRERFDRVSAQLREIWAQKFGRIDPLVLDCMTARAALDGDVMARLDGVEPLETLEQTAEKLANSDEFLMRSIESRDAALRAELEDEALAAIPAQMRMSMERAGALRPHLEKAVGEMLDARATKRFQ